MVISFSLKAHLLTMPPETFWKIIKNDIPGPNPDVDKANTMRTFIIPEEFTVKGSANTEGAPHTIRILAAFMSEEYVTVLCDFSGLARMHVESKSVSWKREDLRVRSNVWINVNVWVSIKSTTHSNFF